MTSKPVGTALTNWPLLWCVGLRRKATLCLCVSLCVWASEWSLVLCCRPLKISLLSFRSCCYVCYFISCLKLRAYMSDKTLHAEVLHCSVCVFVQVCICVWICLCVVDVHKWFELYQCHNYSLACVEIRLSQQFPTSKTTNWMVKCELKQELDDFKRCQIFWCFRKLDSVTVLMNKMPDFRHRFKAGPVGDWIYL